jgi:hypothetical protein
MNSRMLLSVLMIIIPVLSARADEAPRPAEAGTLVILDAAGKEQKLKRWKFTEGVRRLTWLAPADKKGEPGTAAGPEALVFRAETAIHFLDGVVTLIPLARLRSLDYDGEKGTVTARVAVGAKEDTDEVLTGSTRYKKINKLAIEAEVNKGDLGVADVKYLGGHLHSIRGVRFPAPSPAAKEAAGRPAVVISADGDRKTTHQVVDLQALYLLSGRSEKLSSILMFKKTLKLDLAKVKKITTTGGGSGEATCQVVLMDGSDETLTLLESITLDGKPARLEGLIGRVPSGYRLFPVASIAEVNFDTTEEAK